MQTPNLIGQRFGHLTVIARADLTNRSPSEKGRAYWICRCDCGTIKEISTKHLRTRRTTSCGCLVQIGTPPTHGESHTRLYNIWLGMRKRCYFKKHKYYHRYGGRGITVCDEWRDNFASFRNWALSHGYTDTLTIDRIDNDGNYCPENCQWLTQSENTKKRTDYYRKKKQQTK